MVVDFPDEELRSKWEPSSVDNPDEKTKQITQDQGWSQDFKIPF